MQEGFVKVRIFFRHNQYVPVNLSPLQKREEYQRLYYQFIKHAFEEFNFIEIDYEKIGENLNISFKDAFDSRDEEMLKTICL